MQLFEIPKILLDFWKIWVYNLLVRLREEQTSKEKNLKKLKKCLTNPKTYGIINTSREQKRGRKNDKVHLQCNQVSKG